MRHHQYKFKIPGITISPFSHDKPPSSNDSSIHNFDYLSADDADLEADLTVDDASGAVVGTVAASESRAFAIRMDREGSGHLWIELSELEEGEIDDFLEVVGARAIRILL